MYSSVPHNDARDEDQYSEVPNLDQLSRFMDRLCPPNDVSVRHIFLLC